MLTAEQNERLTRVGPGTPMGGLMRRYWHPIAAGVELSEDNPTKEVRLLGEDLVLFRSTVGELGLIARHPAERSSHRPWCSERWCTAKASASRNTS